MKRFFVLLAAIALMSLVAYADVSFSAGTVSPSTLQPGVSGSVSFTITNTDTTSAVNGLTLYPSGTGFVFPSSQISVGTIGASGSSTVSVPFAVSQSTQARVYTIEISAYWNAGTSGVTGYKKISVPVTISNPSVFQISTQPVSAGAGDDFVVKAAIRNTAGMASDARLSINSTSFIARDVSQVFLGDVPQGQDVEFQIPLTVSSSTQPGTYSIPVVITYRDEISASQQAVAYMGPVRVVKGVVDFLVDARVDGDIAPGQKIGIAVDIANSGNKKAYSAKVSVSSASAGFVALGPSEKSLGDMAPEDNTTVNFDIGISSTTSPGYYPITVAISYLNEQGEAQTAIAKTVGLEVGGKPEVLVIASTSPTPVGPGKKYSLSIQVSNVGTTNLKALKVYVKSDVIELFESPYNFIGTLSIDDYSTAQYEVYTPPSVAPGTHPVEVTLEFMDAYNRKHEITQTAYINIASPSLLAISNGSGGGPDLITTLVILAIAAALLYFVVYKRFIKKNGRK
ncbi:MAG: hypothetical protein NT157_05190 [Candidatus Micrarchaeota archaeon]|nr:hypothetical protein [Candidatus Micrarchaeota archaeon]